MPNFLFKPSGDIAEDIRKESLIELMVSAINGSPELVMEHDFLLEMQKISDFVNQGFEEIKKRYFSSSARRAIYTVIANYSDARVCVFLNYHLNENEYLALNIEDLVKLGDEISKINKPAASEVWKKHFRIFYDIAKTKDLTTYLTHIKDMPVHLLIEYLTPLPPKFEHLKDYNITTMQCMEFLLFLVNHSDPKSYPHISQYAKWVFNCFKNNDGSKYAQGMLLAACNRMIKECGEYNEELDKLPHFALQPNTPLISHPKAKYDEISALVNNEFYMRFIIDATDSIRSSEEKEAVLKTLLDVFLSRGSFKQNEAYHSILQPKFHSTSFVAAIKTAADTFFEEVL